MLCYVNLTVDVKKLPQFDKIKEASDLENAILADAVDFDYKTTLYKTRYEEASYVFKFNKINRSKYIDNIEFFNYNLKKKRLVYVYSPNKELEDDGMKFERTNENASLISYTIKLVDDSTYLTKTLEIADAFLDNISKIYNITK